MAVSLPIVTEFDGKGIKKAMAQFKQLETTGEKANFVLKKAALGSTVALAGLTAGIVSATKAAMEDAEAQAQLALTLKNVTGATNAQVAQNEKFISTMARAGAITDDELRPAMAALVRGTKDLGEAQRVMSVAMDVSRATGIDLTTVSDALAKAYQGNYKALRALSPEMATLIKEGASLNEIIGVLTGTYGGAYKAFAESAAGQTANFGNTLKEAKESLGAAFLPVLDAALPKLQAFADWAAKNTETLKVMTFVIGGATAATIALNFAMNVNPIVAMTTGIIAGTVAIGRFREQISGTNRMVNVLIQQLSQLLAPLLKVVDAYNALARLTGLPEMKFGGSKEPSGSSFNGPSSFLAGNVSPSKFSVPSFPTMTTAPALSSGGSSGGRTSSVAAPVSFAPAPYYNTGIDPFQDNPYVRAREGDVNITINSTIADASLPDTIVQALRDYNQTTGPIRVQVA